MDEAPLVSHARACVCFPGCLCFILSSWLVLVNKDEMKRKRRWTLGWRVRREGEVIGIRHN